MRDRERWRGIGGTTTGDDARTQSRMSVVRVVPLPRHVHAGRHRPVRSKKKTERLTVSSGVQFPGGIPDFPFDANLRRPRSVVNSTARRTGPDTPALNQQTWFCNRYSGKNTIMNAMGVTAPVRAQAAAMPTAPQAAASPTEKKNAGDNAGEECPGCENNIQTD